MATARSKDGTTIAYEKAGSGPAVILVDGAMCSRAFGPMGKLVPLLAKEFTVYSYDRRGRNESGDTKPYAKEREVEDLDALIQAAGGSAALVGLSSGGALALEAAASKLGVTKVVAYEPPYVNDGKTAVPDHEARLKALISEGRRGDAVAYFMRDMVAVPAPVVVIMRLMPWIWRKMKAIAHTLPYDAAVMTGFRVPVARLGSVAVPTLVMNGDKTTPALKTAARTVADAVPGAKYATLAGQNHQVNPEVLTPAVVSFLRA